MSPLHTRTTWAALCLATVATLATLLGVCAATTLHAMAPHGAATATPTRAVCGSGTDAEADANADADADWHVDPRRTC